MGLQVQSTEAMRSQARAILADARSKATSDHHTLDFVLLALRGKKVAFDQILKLIDEMVVTLKNEQGDDDDKKGYCEKSLDTTRYTRTRASRLCRCPMRPPLLPRQQRLPPTPRRVGRAMESLP